MAVRMRYGTNAYSSGSSSGGSSYVTGEYKLMIDGVIQDGYARTQGSLTRVLFSDGVMTILNGTGTSANEYWGITTPINTIIATHLPDYELYAVKVEAEYPTSKPLRCFLKSSVANIALASMRVPFDMTGTDYGVIYPNLNLSNMPYYIGTGAGDACRIGFKNITIIGYKNLDLFN